MNDQNTKDAKTAPGRHTDGTRPANVPAPGAAAKPAPRNAKRSNPYGPMSGNEMLWILARAGIVHRYAAERMGLHARTINRWGDLPAVATKYVVALEAMTGGARFFVALRSEYRDVMSHAWASGGGFPQGTP